MNTTTPTAARSAQGGGARAAQTMGGADLVQGHSAQARRQAAAILEVLAGARTPAAAAAALAVSLPRYYQLETQALRGLLAACEPKPRGRQVSSSLAWHKLEQENQRLQREVGRQQALVRAAQRAVGLAAPAPPRPAGKKPRRQRVARALSVAARLQQQASVSAAPAAAAAGSS